MLIAIKRCALSVALALAGTLMCLGTALADVGILTGLAAPGTSSLQTTYVVEDSLPNSHDVYTTTSVPAGLVASPDGISTAQWSAGYGTLGAAAHTAWPGDTSLLGSTASLVVGWTDYWRIVPTSSTEPVTLTLSIALAGNLNTIFDPDNQGVNAYAATGIDDLTSGNQLNQYFCDGTQNLCGLVVSDYGGVEAPSATYTISDCLTGCYVGLYGWMEVFTNAINYNDGAWPKAFADANYLHTADFRLDVLTPGWTATSLSGHDYATLTLSVPEPETYAMMLAGLGLLGFVARRRQRQAA